MAQQHTAPAIEGRSMFMTPEDAARIANITVVCVRDLCRKGTIKAVKVGGQWRIYRDWFMSYLGLSA